MCFDRLDPLLVIWIGGLERVKPVLLRYKRADGMEKFETEIRVTPPDLECRRYSIESKEKFEVTYQDDHCFIEGKITQK